MERDQITTKLLNNMNHASFKGEPSSKRFTNTLITHGFLLFYAWKKTAQHHKWWTKRFFGYVM